jgi:hypothetical protein
LNSMGMAFFLHLPGPRESLAIDDSWRGPT